MNYIDELATKIHRAAPPDTEPWDWLPLYRIYAVLALAKGEAVSDTDVHDAWAAWAATYQPDHRSLIEFYDLPKHTRELDTPYAAAIRSVARERWFAGRQKKETG